MKNFNKILIVLLVISVITSAFVFSASAEENPTVSGVWVFDSTLYGSAEHNGQFDQYVNFTCNGVTYSRLRRYEVAYDLSLYFGNTKVHSNSKGQWTDDAYRTIDFGEVPQTVSPEFYKVFTDYATKIPTECDGSACPATDVNLDDICDDCGMTFAMPRSFTPSDFPSGYTVPSVASDARYYLYRVQSSGSTYVVVYPSTLTPTYDTTIQNGYLTFSESYGSYRLNTSTNEWELNNDDSPYSIGGTNNNSVDILYSSVTIKDQTGETFFPIPLWEKVEKVTEGELQTETLPVVAGTMTTLTLCGVGLMALLVVLSLFGKRSLISIKR